MGGGDFGRRSAWLRRSGRLGMLVVASGLVACGASPAWPAEQPQGGGGTSDQATGTNDQATTGTNDQTTTGPGNGSSNTANTGTAQPLRQPVQCGTVTCGPNEYCENKCTCCGVPIADPSQASGESHCRPLPEPCRTSNPPECQQRTVDIPCA